MQPVAHHWSDAGDARSPVEVAVVMTTVMRPSILRAVRSVFAQEGVGRIQLLIGIDVLLRSGEELADLLQARPPHVSATVLHLPYSTSTQHGGVCGADDGGALRALLTLMANSRHVAYLDDDNAFLPSHLATLRAAVEGRWWAYSQRMLVEEGSFRPIAVDRWHSTGLQGSELEPDGFVDPNCLMIDRVRAAPAIGRWAESPPGRGGQADRNFFIGIRDAEHGYVPEPTVLYALRPDNVLHDLIARDTAAA